MKLSFLLLILFVTANIGSGQTVKWGAKLKENRRLGVDAVVSHHENETILLKSNSFGSKFFVKPNAQLQKYNSSFNLVQTVLLEPEFEGNKLTVENCFESNGNIYILTSFLNQKLEKRFLFVQQVNRKTLAAEGKMHKVAELNFRKRYNAGFFGIEFSRDSSHILIYANTESKKDEPDKFSLQVFDADLNPIWEKEVTMPYSENSFVEKDYAIDNNGNVFILGIRYPEKGEEKPKRGKSSYDYRILSYREDGEDVIEYTASIGDLFLTDMMIDVSPKKDIICAGFYSERGTFSIKGTYYMRINRETKEVDKISLKEFDLDFVTMNFTDRQKEKVEKKVAKGKNVELYNYDLNDLIPRGDGGAVLLAEQYYYRVVCSRDSRGVTVCHTYYHYHDIFVISISPDGDIEWATKIPKYQVSVDDGGYYSSYASMITNDRLYLLYNDTRKNLDQNLQSKLKNYRLGDKNGVIVLASVDFLGNMERKALQSNAEISTILVPKFSSQISSDRLFLFGKNRRGTQMGIATF